MASVLLACLEFMTLSCPIRPVCMIQFALKLKIVRWKGERSAEQTTTLNRRQIEAQNETSVTEHIYMEMSWLLVSSDNKRSETTSNSSTTTREKQVSLICAV